ncbi:hypothetical protein BDM02DRAFT_3130869 [Thelephora ganbajun]|uniref:Uncharacterized protein n=1 Tax=Thelephora ganbajun TaxID=370292 RepID=A0ACB6Z868_THEGA|nr:hypothetical protein BDM02DRAFT_3130869 [Thelephora ganbajun]
MVDNERVLFNLVGASLVDPQEFNKPHKWSSRSIRYLAVVADRLWALFEAECTRNDCVEAELNVLKGQVSLLNNCLLTVDCFSFDANKKVNTELEKDGDKHNTLIQFVRNHSTELELHHCSLLSLRDRMCMCNERSETPIDGSGAVPSFDTSPEDSCQESSPLPEEVESIETPVVVPAENLIPLPVRPPLPNPHCTVVESSTTLQVVSEEEETEDHIIQAWQCWGEDNVTPTTLAGLELNRSSDPSCAVPTMEVTWESLQTQSLGARGYLSTRLLSSDHVGGELQLVFPISQEEFDSLLSGELEAEVHPVVVQDVVQSGAQDDGELKYFEE